MLSFDQLERLQSANHTHLLDVVDALRAQGLSSLFALPQLIVCGDQSSGKSSVLEAISGVPFPKKDQLCTRFATEVILRRNDALADTNATVSILPGSSRSEKDRENLLGFKQEVTTVSKLPDIIASAKDAMGLGSFGHAFSSDVLRLEVTGPMIPQLTIVDLPGLIHSQNKMQTAEDVDLVASLVESYMKQERSIILAVVSAKNDYACQIILDKARAIDRDGHRTLGIITKPDTLYPGSESEAAFLDLAKNRDVKFSLGWHVIRNPDSNNASETAKGRAALETEFFRRSGWNALPADTRGVDALLERLSQILFQQIKRELPSLTRDVETDISATAESLRKLGRGRKSEQDQRMLLSDTAQAFYDICRAGCDGNYDTSFFTVGSVQEQTLKRLRATVQNESIAFASRMRESKFPLFDSGEDSSSVRDEAVRRAKSLVQRSRGRELPGLFSPLLVGELFHDYSGDWQSEAVKFVTLIWKKARGFVCTILEHIADRDVSESCFRLLLKPQLDEVLQQALGALKKITDELQRHPITYDAELMSSYAILKSVRLQSRLIKPLKDKTDARGNLTLTSTIEALSSVVDERIQDMDSRAAEDITDYMMTYYQIALRRFIDNVPSQVVEPVILQKLPQLFNAKTAWCIDATQLDEIAGESVTKQQTRDQLTERLKILHSCEAICKKYSFKLTSGMLDDGVLVPDTPTTEETADEDEYGDDAASDRVSERSYL